MPKCDKCGASDWGVAERPFQRNFCRQCDYLPVATMPGPQTDFVLSGAIHPAYIAGRGAGKSVAGLIKLWKYVHEHPGADGAITFPVLDDVEKILLPRLRLFFGSAQGSQWEYKEKKRQLVFPQVGSRAFILTAEEPDRGAGPDLAYFWMEEAGKGKGQLPLFLNLQPALRQPGYPHQGWLTMTPQVERPWVKQLWVDGVFPLTEEPIEEWAGSYPIFRAKTFDNLTLDKKRRDRLKAEWGDSRLARQELEGEFISVQGIVYPELSEHVHLLAPPPDHEFVRTVVGIDFGDAQPTAMLEMKMDRSRRIWITREFYKRQATEYDWGPVLQEWGATLVLCDPSASEKQIAHWRRAFAVNMKAAMTARPFLERKRLWRSRISIKDDGLPGIYISPECQNLWNELQNLTDYVPKGQEAPLDKFAPGTLDHAWDAGAYGLSFFDKGFVGAPRRQFELVRV